jgi:hypothetical protein
VVFTNVTADHSIVATFAINTHTITPNAGAHGSVTPAGTQTVDEGSDKTFTITPDAGYHIEDVKKDGISIGAVSSATFTHVVAGHTVSAIFAANTPPHATELSRVDGADRYEVALSMATQSFPGWQSSPGVPVDTVIVACGSDRAFADPLCAAGLSGAYSAPILLVRTDTKVMVPSPTVSGLQQIAAANGGRKPRIIVVGGPASVTPGQVDGLRKYASSISRISGLDRYAVAVGVAYEMRSRAGGANPPRVLIAAGNTPTRFFDPLALGAVSARTKSPILLVKGSYVPPVTMAAVRALAPAAGNRFAAAHVSFVNDAALRALGVSAANRISDPADSSRQGLAVAVATRALAEGWLTADNVGIANKIADALSGGAGLGFKSGPILYTAEDGSLAPQTAAFLAAHKAEIDHLYFIGGSGSVPDATIEAARLAVQ